jgi:hypothetical protein
MESELTRLDDVPVELVPLRQSGELWTWKAGERTEAQAVDSKGTQVQGIEDDDRLQHWQRRNCIGYVAEQSHGRRLEGTSEIPGRNRKVMKYRQVVYQNE